MTKAPARPAASRARGTPKQNRQRRLAARGRPHDDACPPNGINHLSSMPPAYMAGLKQESKGLDKTSSTSGHPPRPPALPHDVLLGHVVPHMKTTSTCPGPATENVLLWGTVVQRAGLSRAEGHESDPPHTGPPHPPTPLRPLPLPSRATRPHRASPTHTPPPQAAPCECCGRRTWISRPAMELPPSFAQATTRASSFAFSWASEAAQNATRQASAHPPADG